MSNFKMHTCVRAVARRCMPDCSPTGLANITGSLRLNPGENIATNSGIRNLSSVFMTTKLGKASSTLNSEKLFQRNFLNSAATNSMSAKRSFATGEEGRYSIVYCFFFSAPTVALDYLEGSPSVPTGYLEGGLEGLAVLVPGR